MAKVIHDFIFKSGVRVSIYAEEKEVTEKEQTSVYITTCDFILRFYKQDLQEHRIRSSGSAVVV